VQVLGISADHPFAQKTFAESLQLPYPLLSDFPDLQVIRSYGVLWPHQIGPVRDDNVVVDHKPDTAARRSFFLVDRQGIVRGKWLVANNAVFPSEEMLKVARKMAGKHLQRRIGLLVEVDRDGHEPHVDQVLVDLVSRPADVDGGADLLGLEVVHHVLVVGLDELPVGVGPTLASTRRSGRCS